MRIVLLSVLLALSACRTDHDKPDTDTLPDDTGPDAGDADGDGYTNDVDCDDSDAAIHPGADEICDGIDNDCDATIDQDAVDATTWYADGDGDGWGYQAEALVACEAPSGYVEDYGDCDDDDPTSYPDAPERCDGVDNDCDGEIDEDLNEIWFADADGDGFGNAENSVDSCDPGDGWVEDDGDCDDSDSTVFPGADEECNDIDDDCDGDVDEDLESSWYADADGDGYGDPAVDTFDCEPGEGWVEDASDCDDANSAIHPAATEVCDALDNDCDDLIDDADAPVEGMGTWYTDADGDGFGDDSLTTEACTQPSGTAAYGGDCDDTDPAYNPGEVEDDCTDPADYNCDGSTGYSDGDGDGWAACEDCDDSDAAVNPDAEELCNRVDDDCDGTIDEPDAADALTWYADGDGDGYGDLGSTTTACTQPGGYVAAAYATDCDDTDASVSPVDPERCNGVDDDCDGDTDEGVTDTFFADSDGDGFGDATVSDEACAVSSGWVADDGDCDDGDPAINPDATELCNGADDDCDGSTDEADAADAATWYRDGDSDGYGSPGASTVACDQPSGYAADHSDCDDGDDDVHPGATEHCDGVDEDCDGDVDEEAVDGDTWYVDADADGYGGVGLSTTACTQPSGYVADATDCDDADAGINPGATELCNGVDDDCDGASDEDDAADAATWYVDYDDDGYGGARLSTTACDQPSGYVPAAGPGLEDCDDLDASAYPGADEVCDGADNDCDGATDEAGAIGESSWYVDADADGYGGAGLSRDACDQPSGFVADSSDCDDADAGINPGATELCNGVDDDCDGSVDEGAIDGATWYLDHDSDGYGDDSFSAEACDQPSGYVADATDCDDLEATAYPGATESCDGIDNDCDGLVDDDDPDIVDADDWYADTDDDGYGDAGTSLHRCEGPSGYVLDDSDCDDGEATVNPGADELYDSLDNDCDGEVDEDLWVGTGADGDLEVTGTTLLSQDASGGRGDPDAVAFAVASISGSTITTSDTVSGLAAGDEVLLINLQGSDAAHASVGSYEFGSVASVAGADVTLAEAVSGLYGETDNGDLTDQIVLLQRVPHYEDVTVYAGATLSTDPWDGAGGGVLAFRASGTVWIEDGGEITVSELGYLAGDTGTCDNCDAFQGESYAGEGIGDVYGGPYNETIAGYLANYGGGGANVTGGGGNHAGGATAGDSWNYGGYTAPDPGDSYGQATLATLFLGSGGGGVWNGGYDDAGEDPGPGGDGAGVLYIGCGLLLAEGADALLALGGTTDHWADGAWTYGAGGGAGGSVFLIAEEVELVADAVSAEGGFGEATHLRAGGDGGYGRVRIDCNSCNGYAQGSADANRELEAASEPDPGYSSTP